MLSSSTSSSDSRRRLLVALGVLSVLVAAEIGARVLASGFGHNGDWPSNETFVKFEQLAAAAEPIDTIHAGSSFVAFGVDTRLATNESGAVHYNAGLSAGELESVAFWLREFVVPMASPRRVVLGLGHTELNGSQGFNTRIFFEAPAVRYRQESNVMRRVEESVQSWSTLFGYRRQLRDPRDVGRALIQGEFPEFWGAYGERQDDFSEERIVGRDARVASTPSTDRVALLAELVEWLEKRDIEVVLVLMPTADGFVDQGADDAAADALRDLVGDRPERFVDARGLVDDPELFFDGAHLNPEGQKVFTEALLDAIG